MFLDSTPWWNIGLDRGRSWGSYNKTSSNSMAALNQHSLSKVSNLRQGFGCWQNIGARYWIKPAVRKWIWPRLKQTAMPLWGLHVQNWKPKHSQQLSKFTLHKDLSVWYTSSLGKACVSELWPLLPAFQKFTSYIALCRVLCILKLSHTIFKITLCNLNMPWSENFKLLWFFLKRAPILEMLY